MVGRPDHGEVLINKFSSILTSYEALRPILMDKRREDPIISVENFLLEEVLGILKKAESTFDIGILFHTNIASYVTFILLVA